MFSTSTSEDTLFIMKTVERLRMEKKKIEEEEEKWMDKLSSCIRNLPLTKNPSLPVSSSFFAAAFREANLDVVVQPVPKKRRFEEDEDNNNNNNIPLKMPKIEKEEDNNEPKKKEKKSIYHYLTGDGKKRWGVLSHLKNVKQENKINWAKVWCNKTHTTCALIGPEDELDNDDFDRVNQLIQDQIILTKKAALEKAEKESSSSSSSSSSESSSSFSSSSSSRSMSSSPSSPLYRKLSEDIAEMNVLMEKELDKALGKF
jgi:hypothetical protein